MEMNQYITIQNDKIFGTIIRKYENTMSVKGFSGKTYVCWIDKKIEKATNRGRCAIPIVVIFPDGDRKEYSSQVDASKEIGVPLPTLRERLKDGSEVTRGMFAGFKFERVQK